MADGRDPRGIGLIDQNVVQAIANVGVDYIDAIGGLQRGYEIMGSLATAWGVDGYQQMGECYADLGAS